MMDEPSEHGEWLIEQIVREAERQHEPLIPQDVELLRTPIAEIFEQVERPEAVRLTNRVVALARSAMIRAKAEGSRTVKARRGLRVPADWYEHYDAVYSTNLDWAVAAIMQNAMIKNPMGGELRKWRSR